MTPNDNSGEGSRILVDEDWKQQVEREKEELRKQKDPAEPSSPPLPEAPPFDVLISMLANQALAALGILPGPDSGESEPDRAAAKFFIDLLGELEKKTKGNLSAEESGHLSTALHHLRMVFVSNTAAAKNGPSGNEKGESIIELP